MKKKIGLYDNRTQQGKDAFYKVLKELPPDEYYYELKKNLPVQSIGQVRKFHAVCQQYAIYTGLTMEEMKNEFKKARYFEMITDKQGREFKRLKSTNEIKDVAEYAALINNLIQWGREQMPEFHLTDPKDMSYVEWMNLQNDYEASFSG